MGEKQKPVTTQDHWAELAKTQPGQKIFVDGILHVVCMTSHDDRKFTILAPVQAQLAA